MKQSVKMWGMASGCGILLALCAALSPLGCSREPAPAAEPTAEQLALAAQTYQQALAAAQLYQQAAAAGNYATPPVNRADAADETDEPEPADEADEARPAKEAEPAEEEEAEAPEGPSPTDQPVPAVAAEEAPFVLAPDQLNQVEMGMSYDDIRSLLENPGQTISNDASDVLIFKWTDPLGTSFVGRFEDGRLVQKSTLQRGEQEASHQPLHVLSTSDYNAIQPGMSMREAMARLPFPAKSLSSGASDVEMFKWEDDMGSSFIARFEGGKLVRKTGLTVAAVEAPEEEAEETAEEEELADEEGAPVVADREEETAPRAETPAPAEEAAPARQERRVFRAPAPERRVHIAGETRREREDSREDPNKPGGSYTPEAELPDFTWSLRRGVYEIRVNNPSNSRVAVGLRAGKSGRDVIVPPGGSRSFQVDRGAYEIHYIYNDDPYTRYGGQTLVVDGVRLGNVDITLFDEAIDVQRLLPAGAYRF